MKARDYRHTAHEKCAPFSGRLALIELLYDLISGVASATGILELLAAGPLELSLSKMQKKVNDGEAPQYEELFSGFYDFVAAFLLELVEAIFICLWSLLLVIPGIIASYAYSMAFFILADNPGMSCMDALGQSKKMMKGHKWQLFCLELSYIGWIILSVCTFGILSFWVSPKIRQAKYQFYLNVKGQN